MIVGWSQQKPCGSPKFSLKILKISKCYAILAVWHSRGRGFDSLQLHQNECTGLGDKPNPFFFWPRQHCANKFCWLPCRSSTRVRRSEPACAPEKGRLNFFQEAAPPVAFLLQKQIFSGTFRSGMRSGRMMGAFQIFKRPWPFRLGVWTFQ